MVEYIRLRYNNKDMIVCMCESDGSKPGVLEVGIIFENKNKNFPADRTVIINEDLVKQRDLNFNVAKELVK